MVCFKLGLERALGVDTGCIDVELAFVAPHRVLVETFKLLAALLAVSAAAAGLLEQLASVANHFIRFLGDVWLELALCHLFMLLQRTLIVQHFFLAFAVVDEQIFGLLLSNIVLCVGLGFECQTFNLFALLLRFRVSYPNLQLLSLFHPPMVQPFAIVDAGGRVVRHRWSAGC